MAKARTPKPQAPALDPMVSLSLDAEVNRLALLWGSAQRLGERIHRWRRDHPPGHRCRCCTELRESETGGLTVMDFLVAMEAVIWSSSACNAERPQGRADLRKSLRHWDKWKKRHANAEGGEV